MPRRSPTRARGIQPVATRTRRIGASHRARPIRVRSVHRPSRAWGSTTRALSRLPLMDRGRRTARRRRSGRRRFRPTRGQPACHVQSHRSHPTSESAVVRRTRCLHVLTPALEHAPSGGHPAVPGTSSRPSGPRYSDASGRVSTPGERREAVPGPGDRGRDRKSLRRAVSGQVQLPRRGGGVVALSGTVLRTSAVTVVVV